MPFILATGFRYELMSEIEKKKRKTPRNIFGVCNASCEKILYTSEHELNRIVIIVLRRVQYFSYIQDENKFITILKLQSSLSYVAFQGNIEIGSHKTGGQLIQA